MDSTISVISVRLHMPNLQKLQALARVEGDSVGGMIRKAVSAYLDSRLREPQLQERVEAARAEYDEMLAQLRPNEDATAGRDAARSRKRVPARS